mgnify:CR=1 FL=1
MSNDRDTERTIVLATYPARRDAERAQQYLEDADISAFVTADDAGGMHPQLQRPHGVKLRVLEGAAEEARERLADGGLLPDPAMDAAGEEEAAPSDLTFSLKGTAGTLGSIALLLILLYFLLQMP